MDSIEADLLEKARRGDPAAAPFLVSYLGEHLLGYARSIAPDLTDPDRERVVELAVEAGVRAIARFDPEKGALRPWFRQQVRWQAMGWRRSHSVTTELPVHLTETLYEFSEPTTEVRTAVAAIVRTLEVRDQVLVALRSVEGLTFTEIGQRLDLSEDNARQRYHRLIKKLRTLASEEGALSFIGGGEA